MAGLLGETVTAIGAYRVIGALRALRALAALDQDGERG
jgi:hypothetical protein